MNRILKALGAVTGFLAIVILVILERQVPKHQMPFHDATQADMFDLSRGTDSVHLVKQESWQVQTGTGTFFPADGDKVKAALESLASLQVEDEISDRADRADEFEIGDASGTRVTLFRQKTRQGTGIFGKQTPDFVHIFFRFPDRPNVYLARGLIRGELEPLTAEGWRSRGIVTLSEAEVLSMTVDTPKGKVELQRSSDTWTLNGKPVNTAPVYALLGAAAHLQADDFINDIHDLALNAGTVVLHGAKETVELRLGAPDPKTKRVPVKSSKTPGGFWISADKAASLLVAPSAFSTKP